MKRLAAHYIFIPPNDVFKRHCVESDDDNRLQAVFPLIKEMASTVFYNGILVLLQPQNYSRQLLEHLKEERKKRPETSIFELLAKQDFTEVKKNDYFITFVYSTDYL